MAFFGVGLAYLNCEALVLGLKVSKVYVRTYRSGS